MDYKDMLIILLGLFCGFFIIAWAYERKKQTQIKNPEELIAFIINWLDVMYDNPHMRRRIDIFFDSEIKPSLNNFFKKVMGPQNMDKVDDVTQNLISWYDGRVEENKAIQEEKKAIEKENESLLKDEAEEEEEEEPKEEEPKKDKKKK